MAVKVTKKYICDICGKEYSEEEYWDGKDSKPSNCKMRRYIGFPVIFHTEQTEGTPCPPYIDFQNLDICDECAFASINIHANGAQGYNKYKLNRN